MSPQICCELPNHEGRQPQKKKLHAIMVSLPFQGHINPFIGLALKLASKGITVTFIHLEFVQHMLSQAHDDANNNADLFSRARESGYDIRYETMSDGLPLEFDRDLHLLEYIQLIIDDFPGRVDKLVEKKLAEFSDGWINFLVSDTFYFWTPAVAQKYNLLSVSLWTQPAHVFSPLYHLQLLQEKGHFPSKDDGEEAITYIPGIPSIKTKDLNYIRESEALTVIGTIATYAFTEVKKADFILHNTVEELEPLVLSALNQYQQNYAIGPLNLFDTTISSGPLNKSIWGESDCTDWLNSKPPGSVLYASFGSFIHSSKELIDEVAYGLLLSGVNFIWVLRTGILATGDTYHLPAEYQEEKMKEKGMIIPWSNQISILSNPAVGGFLTHGGWNSTIEGIWYGVPMICYPFAHDQMTNRRLMVEDWEIGVNLSDGKSVDRREVAEKIKSFFGSNDVRARRRISHVKQIVRSASGAGGSSQRNFDNFYNDLVDKIHSKYDK